jgi:hypothetical protein
MQEKRLRLTQKVIKSESDSTSYLSKILSRGMENDDNEANEEDENVS